MTEAPELSDNEKIGIIESLKKADPAQLTQALIAEARNKSHSFLLEPRWDCTLNDLVLTEERTQGLKVNASLKQAVTDYMAEAGLQKFFEILNTPLYPKLTVENVRFGLRAYTNSPLNLSSSLLHFLSNQLNINIHYFPVVRAEIQNGKVFWQLIDPKTKEVVYDRQTARKKPEFKFGENSWEMSWEDFQEFKDAGEKTKKEPETVFTLHLFNFVRNHSPNITMKDSIPPRDWKTFKSAVITQLSKELHVSAVGTLRSVLYKDRMKDLFFQQHKDNAHEIDKLFNDKAKKVSKMTKRAGR